MATVTAPVQDKTPRIDVVRVLLTVLAMLPYLIGWAAGKAWSALTWVWAAVRAGWHDAAESEAPR